jgi:Fe2+ or Zn2+ uptake regulation protein
MTLSRTDWQKDNTIPPKANEAVAQIMAERGVNRRRAYELLRAQKLAEVDTSSVGQGQRIAVLTCLITHPESGRDATVLLDALHRAGVKIDMHDTVKTLWVLQKTRYVQFREKGNRSLYAIKITDEGLRAYGEMSAPPAAQEVAVLSHVLELADEVIEQEEKAAEPERVVLSSMEFTVPLTPKPWPPDMEGWPALRDIRNRAEKAAKIGAALKLLEEVGEEDIALTLMGRIEFTELEEEVINLLKIMGEITE